MPLRALNTLFALCVCVCFLLPSLGGLNLSVPMTSSQSRFLLNPWRILSESSPPLKKDAIYASSPLSSCHPLCPSLHPFTHIFILAC